MRKRRLSAVWLVVPGLWLFACERDRPLGEGPGDLGDAGATENGDSGQANTLAGQPGTAATAGRSNDGGRGGAGGRSGTAGTAGEAGADPNAPQGGTSSGGTGGFSGMFNLSGCGPGPVSPKFDDSHCATPTFTMEGSTCTAAETREQLACGEPGSPFDTACCRRPDCDSDDACGDGGRCLPRQVQAPMPEDFLDSGYESCEPTCAGCQCFVTEGLDVSGFCIPAEDVARFDCPVAGVDCEALTTWREGLDIYLTVAEEFREPHPAAEMQRCLERVEAELIASCGGCGEDPPEPIDLSHCSRRPFLGGGSTCSEEQTRGYLNCGVPGSANDADCCRRQECDSDESCGSGASCIPTTIGVPGSLSQRGRLFACGATTCGRCTCEATADAGPAYDAFCIATSEDVSRFDCPVDEASCSSLETWRDGLPAYRDAFSEQSRPALAERVDACLARVATELAARCGDD